MSRCNRHFDRNSEPYRQFSFQKSLRKYEVLPHKKVKLTASSIEKPIDRISEIQSKIYLDSSENNREHKGVRSIEKTSNEENALQLKSIQFMNKQIILERQKNEQLKIGTHVPIVQLERVLNSQIIQGNDELLGVQEKKIDQFELKQPLQQSHILQQQICWSESKQQLNQSIVAENKMQENVSQIIVISKQQKIGPDQHSKITEGRFHLTDSVSISLRNIAKYKERGCTDLEILEKLFSQRKYLEIEKSQIALKLNGYLHFS